MRFRAVEPDAAGWGDTAVGPWTRRSRRTVYKNDWLSLHHDEVTRPDGSAGIYGVVHFANMAVGVVPIDDQDRVALVGQHRYTLDAMSWEIPEGGSPVGEDPLDGARRELREETGLKAGEWQRIGGYHTSNSVSDEEAFLYVATDLTEGPADPEPSEELHVRWVDFSEALAMVAEGAITDALTVIALQAVALRRAQTR
jgi:8-oxo-dGTP pyrophosphatase MutT (NUDIX family)